MTEVKSIEKINFNDTELDSEYYKCIFISCDFSNLTIVNTIFEECVFRSCNFTLTKFKCTLRDVCFIDCKMTGVNFTELNRLSNSLAFKKSNMDYVNFVGVKMHKAKFTDCNLNEAYFDDADIASSVFDKCDLTRTSFFRTNLEKVDFYTSSNFTIIPTDCRLKKTIFSEQELRGLVSHLDIEIKV